MTSMPTKTFSGGVHPAGYKHLAKDRKIRPASPPKQVILPLSQHTGKPSQPIVKAGDYVKVGAKIAQAEGFVSSSLHSPVSGTVKAIEAAPHPIIGRSLAIIIDVDEKEKGDASVFIEKEAAEKQKRPLFLSGDEIIKKIQDAGVVGMGGAAFPTHVKLSPPKDKKINILIINGAECEPYLTCDYRLMLEQPDDIIKGAMIMCKALGVTNCIIGIEDNKADAVAVVGAALAAARGQERTGASPAPTFDIKIISLPAKYPQGGEKQLIKVLTGKEVPSGGLPFDAGVVVQNVATALAVSEAVALNKPLYERVVTVSGDCIKEPSNLLVAIGTPVSQLVQECGGFTEEPAKVIFGGPMMGISQHTLDVPVIKGTSGVLFLGRGPARRAPTATQCIRCGGCVRVCPAGLAPTNIYYAAERRNFGLAEEYSAVDCIECGACSFECPAKLDLAGMIKYTKRVIAGSKVP